MVDAGVVVTSGWRVETRPTIAVTCRAGLDPRFFCAVVVGRNDIAPNAFSQHAALPQSAAIAVLVMPCLPCEAATFPLFSSIAKAINPFMPAAQCATSGCGIGGWLIAGISVIPGEGQAARSVGPIFRTTKEATQAAKSLGFKRIKETVNGQAVYRQGNRYITRDVDGHNGGAWKMAGSIKGLSSKETRAGTFSADMRRIGD